MLRPGRPYDRPVRGDDTSRAASVWARSGVMALCGHAGGSPLLPPLGAAPRLTEVAEEISRRTTASGRTVSVRWDAALAGRAALLGFTRNGRISANGSCRLLAARDGDVALNLPRPDDLSLIPALTADPLAEDSPWESAAALAASIPAADFAGRARLLGLAASAAGERAAGAPFTTTRRGEPLDRPLVESLTVVDLSALWAGPLAARVLAEAGARVTKVEDPERPDAARQRPEFYSWIHHPSETIEHVDFASASGRRRLQELLEAADVVIESSRPRALGQIGLAPERLRAPAGQVWLSITAHGRTGYPGGWVGFGDDAAVAGGFHCVDHDGRTVFCGDAIADPITGLVGALAVLRSLAAGGGQLLDVSMSGAAAWAAATRSEGAAPDIPGPVAERPPSLEWISSAST